MNKVIAFLFVVFTAVACRDKHVITDMSTPEEITAIASARIDDYCVSDCFVADSILALVNGCGKEWFSLYSLKTLSHISDFGVKGANPGELLRPQIFKDTDHDSGVVTIYDVDKLKSYSLNLHDIVSGENQFSLLMKTPETVAEHVRPLLCRRQYHCRI
ncbi:MAG: TolB-like 6-bladed beta-propeller domain-containing protein [Rikenellaceae bacterium]|jgi:hypothetical protein|nr:TolB-like 6-bladed beta-propeller domain-containing protein [Rikenellaceae bacterium]